MTTEQARFDNIARLVHEQRPELSGRGVRAACDQIAGCMRLARAPVRGVELSPAQLGEAAGHYVDHVIEVRGVPLWLRLWLDCA